MISSAFVKQKALEVGLDICGIARAVAMPQMLDRLNLWIAKGYQAQMEYMEQFVEMRSNPQLLVPEAKSVICVGLCYKPDRIMKGPYKIAQYAYGQDYHEVIKSKLFALTAAIREQYPDFEAKPCVDTVPISDKLWAEQAGLGWIGRNTLLVTSEFGSYINLGELVTTADCDAYDAPIGNRCGDCHKCENACPNGAIEGTMLNAGLCNAYNTIENRSERLSDSLNLQGYAFGCDCCQRVCPYNQNDRAKVVMTESQIEELEQLPYADKAAFRRFAKHRALNRIRYEQWQRNIEKIKTSLSEDQQNNYKNHYETKDN